MSSAPDRSPSAPANPARSVQWRVLHSLWLLVPILGCSCLGGFAMIYIGLRANRRAWWLSGILYALLSWPLFAVVGETERESAVSDWAIGALFAIWIANIVHAALINPAWLRWRATYRPWYADPAASGRPGLDGQPSNAPPPPPTTTDLVPPPSTYYGTGPAAAVSRAPEAGPARPDSLPRTVDVNTVEVEQLAALPGFDVTRARTVLAERARRGGFGSVNEFVTVANLAPHEYARLRHVLVCQPPPPSGFDALPPQGRVVDV